MVDQEDSELDAKIKAIITEKSGLELYESNKKFKPSLTYAENEATYNLKEEFNCKFSAIASKGPITINTPGMQLDFCIIASLSSITFSDTTDSFGCFASYIQAPSIIFKNSIMEEWEVIEEVVCNFVGNVSFINYSASPSSDPHTEL